MRMVLAVGCAALLCLGAVAYGQPYEEMYYPPGSVYLEGEPTPGAFPEEAPWDWEWYTTGGGAQRTATNGIFTVDGAGDPQIADYYVKERPGQLDAEAGELFYLEWRMRLLVPPSDDSDVRVYVSSDDGDGDIDLGVGSDHIYSYFEYRLTEVDTTEWHTYRIESTDMGDYDFFIDDQYIYTGFFDWPGITSSHVIFGDGGCGEASSSEWSHVRFGTVRVGDFNADTVIDLIDFATFARCYHGAAVTVPPAGCTSGEFYATDIDNDLDVDLSDFGVFALAYGT